jgi:ElaB/YqjD/DUF883 family membrane-anchored ribosome-binding protein
MSIAEPLRESSSYRDQGADLGRQVQELQDDVRAIAATLTRMAESRASELRQDAQKNIANLVHGGQEAVEDVVEKAYQIEGGVEQSVRRQPLLALSIALAVGFALSQALRR